VPPPPGTSPRVTSGWPNFAVSTAILIVHAHRGLSQAAAERKAIHRRYHGLAEVLDEIEDLLPETAGPLRIERKWHGRAR